MSQVALVHCPDYSQDRLVPAVRNLFDHFGGAGHFVRPGDTVLLKPNFLKTGRPEKAISTHPAVIEAVLATLRDCGAGRIWIGEDPPFSTTKFVARSLGLIPIAKRYGAELVDFRKDVPMRNGEFRFLFSQAYDHHIHEADVLLNLPKLKAHCQLVTSGAVKNLYGCIAGKQKALMHYQYGERNNDFAEMLVENYLHLKPAFSLMDGIVAMEGMGPGLGDPRPLNVLAGAVDAVALDRVITEIIGFDPSANFLHQAARTMGVGETDFDRIKILGEPVERFKVTDFKHPEMMPIRFSVPRLVKSVVKTYYQRWFVEKKAA
ncbi:MAG: DUF362 domain-containing protein [Verrucomicrobiae bacterium]|nr:DUF362 domain-containing protein [Verrucomicrobiae bacterium]